MKRTIKKLLTLFCAWMMAGALSVSACAATIDGTAKLTITPTEPKVSGDMATVTYELTVTPPEGKELGVFSIQLQPSEGMELAENFEISTPDLQRPCSTSELRQHICSSFRAASTFFIP